MYTGSPKDGSREAHPLLACHASVDYILLYTALPVCFAIFLPAVWAVPRLSALLGIKHQSQAAA